MVLPVFQDALWSQMPVKIIITIWLQVTSAGLPDT